jgi:hypothetical protein
VVAGLVFESLDQKTYVSSFYDIFIEHVYKVFDEMGENSKLF